MCKRTEHRVTAKTVVLNYLKRGFSVQINVTEQSPTKRLASGSRTVMNLPLELEIQRRAFDFPALFVTQLQLHFVVDQPSVELELAAFVTEPVSYTHLTLPTILLV